MILLESGVKNKILSCIPSSQVPKQVAWETLSVRYDRQMPGEIILVEIISLRIPKGADGISKLNIHTELKTLAENENQVNHTRGNSQNRT